MLFFREFFQIFDLVELVNLLNLDFILVKDRQESRRLRRADNLLTAAVVQRDLKGCLLSSVVKLA